MKNCPGGSASCGGRVPAHCLSRVASHCPRKQLHASLRPQSTLQGTLWLECLDMRHEMIWYMTWLNCIWLSNDWFCYLATGGTYIWYWRVTPPTSATPSTPGSTMSLPRLHSGWTALSLYLYILYFCLFCTLCLGLVTAWCQPPSYRWLREKATGDQSRSAWRRFSWPKHNIVHLLWFWITVFRFSSVQRTWSPQGN